MKKTVCLFGFSLLSFLAMACEMSITSTVDGQSYVYGNEVCDTIKVSITLSNCDDDVIPQMSINDGESFYNLYPDARNQYFMDFSYIGTYEASFRIVDATQENVLFSDGERYKFVIGKITDVEIDLDNGIAVFPTISSDYVSIRCKSNSIFRVYSMMGKLMTMFESYNSVYQLNISNYSAGTYMVVSENGSKSFFIKK